jgi:hypothetical protein
MSLRDDLIDKWRRDKLGWLDRWLWWILALVMVGVTLVACRVACASESKYMLTSTVGTVNAVSVNRPVEVTQNIVGDKKVVLQTLAMESASRPEGIKFVAITLYNRALKRGTSISYEALRAHQYSCWNSSKWAKTWLDKHYGPKTRQRAEKWLKMGMLEAVDYPGLTHYHTIETSPYWAKGHTPALILGGHKWYRGIK